MALTETDAILLVPCNAPGGIKEYTEYVKAGHYIPGAVLDPDLGIEYEIFSKRVSLPSIPSADARNQEYNTGSMGKVLKNYL